MRLPLRWMPPLPRLTHPFFFRRGLCRASLDRPKGTIMHQTRLRLFSAIAALVVALPVAQAQTPATPPAISAKDQPRADRWIDGHSKKLAQLEAFIALTDPVKILDGQVGSIVDLRREMRNPHPNIDFRAHPDFAALDARLDKARTELARRGLYVGEWREWGFDGQTVGEEEAKFLLSVEDKVNGLRGSNSVSPEGDAKIAKLQEILNRPEFGSNPVLKAYKDGLGQHIMFGIVYRNGLVRVKAIGNSFRSLKNDVDKNWGGCKGGCVTRVHGDATNIITWVDQVKGAGLDLKAYKIKLDEREPLSEEWDLEKVRAEAVKISKKK